MPTAERRRFRSQVENDVENGPPHALHDLRLPVGIALVMQSAKRSRLPVVGQAALHELGDQLVFGELAAAPRAGEKTALVRVFLDFDRVGAAEARFMENHGGANREPDRSDRSPGDASVAEAV